MHLFDTNTLIYFFKGQGRVAERLLSCAPADSAVSILTVYELEVGLAKSASPEKRRSQLEEFLGALRVLPFGLGEARAAAQLRASLEQAGQPIGPIDTLIAGTALCHGATLVTRNAAEFSRVAHLKLENWYD